MSDEINKNSGTKRSIIDEVAIDESQVTDLIEKYDAEDDVFNICEQPYVPFIGLNKNNDGIYCSTSGGAWDNVPKNKLKYFIKKKE